MDLPTSISIGSAIAGGVSVVAIVVSTWARRKRDGDGDSGPLLCKGHCADHPAMLEDVRDIKITLSSIKKVALRIAHAANVETRDIEELVE